MTPPATTPPAYDLLVVGEINPDLILRGADLEPAFGQAEKLVADAALTVGSSSVMAACGAARLGLGFETGVVTHVLDGGGRPQGQILKRTYKIALVKGDRTHPWLIDAYEVSEATAKLSTTTVAPVATARPSD